MRIAIVNHGISPFAVGGMERHTAMLARHLAEMGAEIEVIIPKLTAAAADQLASMKLSYSVVQCPWPQSITWLHSNYLFSQQVRQHLLKKHYDAVYCQGFSAWAYLADLSRKNRTSMDSTVTLFNPHGLEMFKTTGCYQTLKHYPLRFAARAQAKRADVTISLGGQLTDEIIRYLKMGAEKIRVIPNAVDLKEIDSHSQKEPRYNCRFVFAGRFEPRKGIDILCQAFHSLEQANLFVAGSGPMEQKLRTLYAKTKIDFVGQLDDRQLTRLYFSSDAFVMASLSEGMPTVILEAMACGLPIIATDIGAVSTMVKEDNGFLVPPGDEQALRQAILRYIKLDEAKKQAMREASRRRVEQEFNWPKIAKLTLDCILARAGQSAGKK